jgi:hypothetical protein
MDPERELLRHTLATVAYRGGKAVRDAPPAFASFRAGDSSRTSAEILAHIGDLFDWALSLAKGRQDWHDSTPLAWEQEVVRFFETIGRLDEHLASDEPLATPAERLFQGPIADALTHVGQLTMMRRLSGARMRSENCFKADIAAGRVGPDQAPPRREFD